jgi:hypothetical protein
VINILKANGIKVTADPLKKFNFTVEEFLADSTLLKREKKETKYFEKRPE